MTASPGPITEAIPDVSKLRKTFDDLNEQVATLTEENEALTAALAESRAATDAANARAGDLAKLVDAAAAGQAVDRPRTEGEHLAGDLVQYVFRDVVTNDQLSGPGVIVRPGEGALVVAPLSPAQLQLPTEAVQHLTVAAMLGEDEPEDEDA